MSGTTPAIHRLTTDVLSIAYEASGPESGRPVVLMHGFPYDPRAPRPSIAVPTIALHGADDDVIPLHASANHERFFTGRYERRALEGVGHDVPQEAPRAFADAVLDVDRWSVR